MLCMAAIGNAQEKKGGIRFETGLGFTCFGNYPAVSVFTDPVDKYGLIPTDHFTLGYRTSYNFFYGLTVGSRGGYTSYRELDEVLFDIDVMADLRLIYPIGSRTELELGVSAGLLIHNNSFDFANDTYSFSRTGFAGHFTAGLNYNLSSRVYVGVHLQCPYGGTLWGDKAELPAAVQAVGYESTNIKTLYGYGVQFKWGFKF